jgi:hypothetical protein
VHIQYFIKWLKYATCFRITYTHKWLLREAYIKNIPNFVYMCYVIQTESLLKIEKMYLGFIPSWILTFNNEFSSVLSPLFP